LIYTTIDFSNGFFLMITISPYNPEWKQEFQEIGMMLRKILGDLALRIDHIGLTSVPNLDAKDIIDIQVTVESLTPELERAMNLAGFERVTRITSDHIPPESTTDPKEWEKWIFKPASASRKINVHVRIQNRANQRYPILFRDYLRALPMVAQAYGKVKHELVKYHPEEDMEAYYDIKDPVCDIIIGGAEEWAKLTSWSQGKSDC
jgi:GrpB-like predicted nucleotidyltransferase (UPF0157 family)